jgi:ribosomal protein S18 acetylase RimI-like enzyme
MVLSRVYCFVQGGGMIDIRETRRQDLPGIVGLLNELAATLRDHDPVDLHAVQGVFQEMEKTKSHYVNLTALADNVIVGFMSLLLYKTLLHPGGTALINELVIAEGRRGRGIGGALIERAFDLARQRGVEEIEVGTEMENEGAKRFYRRHGFDTDYLLLGQTL